MFYKNLTNPKLKSQEICEGYWESNLQLLVMREIKGVARAGLSI